MDQSREILLFARSGTLTFIIKNTFNL